MRTLIENASNTGGLIPSTVNIIFPDKSIYLKDANFITLEFNSANTIRYIEVIVKFLDGGNNVMKTYASSVYHNVIKFNLNNFFADYYAANNDGEKASLYFGGIDLIAMVFFTSSTSEYNMHFGMSDTFKIYDGYSLPNRSHGTDNSGFVPPYGVIDGGCISALATDAVMVQDGKDTQFIPEGEIFNICRPEDGCYRQYNVTTTGKGVKNWDVDYFDWTFGITCVDIDRCDIINDNFGLLKTLVDYGFDVSNLIYSTYQPLSARLYPTSKRGVWRIGFYSNVDDHVVYTEEYNGYLFYLKEENDNALYAIDWNDPSEFVTARQFKCYALTTADMEDGDFNKPVITIANAVDWLLRPLVKYDAQTYTDENYGYESFSGQPLTAIRFYTDVNLFGVNEGAYHYGGYIKDYYGGTHIFAHYWMFGNHLNYDSVDPEIEFFTTDYDAIQFYRTIPKVGCGLQELISPDEVFWTDPIGYYTFNLSNAYNRRLLPQNTLWYNLWCYWNSSILRNIEVYRWDSNTLEPSFFQRLTQSRYTTKYYDYACTLPDWCYGVPFIGHYKTELYLDINGTIIVTPRQNCYIYTSYDFDETMPTYVTQSIPLYDGVNYYHFDGTIASDSYTADYIRVSFQMTTNELYEFDYVGQGLQIDSNNTLVMTTNDSSVTCNLLYMRRPDLYETFSAYYYLPFVCKVPFVKQIDEQCAQYGKVNLIIQPAGVNPYYPNDDHQILQLERYYETYTNVGNNVSVNGVFIDEQPDLSRNLSKGYLNNDKTLTTNTDQYEDFAFITLMYAAFDYNPTLHVEDFNTYNDNSSVLKNGCDMVDENEQPHGGIEGTVLNYTAYTFSMCNEGKYVWIKYKNMDGLWRYLPAEIVDTSYTNQRQDLQFINPTYSPINAYPLWKPYSLEEKITVYISNVPAELHIEDMLYSTPLELISSDGSYTVYVALEEDTITRDGNGGENFVLHFIKKQ